MKLSHTQRVLLVLVFAFVAAELVFRLRRQRLSLNDVEVMPPRFETLQGQPIRAGEQNNLQKQSYRSSRRLKDGTLLYQNVTTVLPDTTRLSTQPHNTKEFILMLGCSFAAGMGVQDDETLSSQLAKFSDRYHTYNLALHGSDPAGMVQRLLDFHPENVKQNSGWAVYVYIPHHMERLVGSLRYLGSWGADRPYFTTEQGEFKNPGTWREVFPLRSYLAEWSRHSQLIWTLAEFKPTPADWQRIYDVFAEMEKVAKNKFGAKGLIVLLWPGTNAPELKKIPVSHVVSLNLPAPEIPHDRHPAPKAYENQARTLAEYLNGLSSAPSAPSPQPTTR